MKKTFVGIDLGGTNIRGGLVNESILAKTISKKINANGSAEEVLQELFYLTDELVASDVSSIGIGVPGLIDRANEIVFDVVNIPAWKEVPLKKIMEERYNIPVYVENDANCFALGEHYFGKGRGYNSMIGLAIGTGLGSGIIINNKLYAGRNGGAGEFGMIEYLDQYYEYYACGQFFQNVYNINGEVVYKNACEGNADALKMYEEMGTHLGNAIKMILFALDVELIILGGSVRHAFTFFEKALWRQVQTFPFTGALQNLKIEVSELDNAGILGAAGLCYDS